MSDLCQRATFPQVLEIDFRHFDSRVVVECHANTGAFIR